MVSSTTCFKAHFSKLITISPDKHPLFYRVTVTILANGYLFELKISSFAFSYEQPE